MRTLLKRLIAAIGTPVLLVLMMPAGSAGAVAYGCNGPDTVAAASNGLGTATLKATTCVEVNTVSGGYKQVRAHTKIECYLSAIKTPCQEISGTEELHMQGVGVVKSSPLYDVSNRSTLDMYSDYWCGDTFTHTFYGKGVFGATLPNGVPTSGYKTHNSFPTARNCISP